MSSTRPDGRIFISYRRSDSDALAGRLSDRLVARFGDGQVFMDVDSIEPGLDFREVIAEAVGSCDVLLAVVGPGWLSAADRTGDRRLDSPNDLVRLEIESALARGVRVIPVLIAEAKMPRTGDLPPSLAPLASRNATHLRHASFAADFSRLSEVLDRVLSDAAEQRALAGSTYDSTPSTVDADTLAFDGHASPGGAHPHPVTAARDGRRGRPRVALTGVLIAAAVVTFGAFQLVNAGERTAGAPRTGVLATNGNVAPTGDGILSSPRETDETPTSPDRSPEQAATSFPDTRPAGGDQSLPSASPFADAIASIAVPADGASVTRSVSLQGAASLPANAVLWVVIEPPDQSIHLTIRKPVFVDGVGRWSTEATVGRGSGDAGNRYTFYAVAAPQTGSVFQTFVAQGGSDGFAEMPTDVRVLDSASVTLS